MSLRDMVAINRHEFGTTIYFGMRFSVTWWNKCVPDAAGGYIMSKSGTDTAEDVLARAEAAADAYVAARDGGWLLPPLNATQAVNDLLAGCTESVCHECGLTSREIEAHGCPRDA